MRKEDIENVTTAAGQCDHATGSDELLRLDTIQRVTTFIRHLASDCFSLKQKGRQPLGCPDRSWM